MNFHCFFFASFFVLTNVSTMSWLDLNYVFGESFGYNTSTFIMESTVGAFCP
ncbi:hypothetical protein Hanom_Chr05g00442331 [Helianthus anomalus]